MRNRPIWCSSQRNTCHERQAQENSQTDQQEFLHTRILSKCDTLKGTHYDTCRRLTYRASGPRRFSSHSNIESTNSCTSRPVSGNVKASNSSMRTSNG